MSNGLSYSANVNDVFIQVENYFKTYNDLYIDLRENYGMDITYMILSPTYRTFNDYEIFVSASTTPNLTIDLFGLYEGANNLNTFTRGLKAGLSWAITYYNISDILFGNKIKIRSDIKANAENLLKTKIISIVNDKIDSILSKSNIITFENNRNALIRALDRVNFLTKYEFDAKKDADKYYKASLSGFTNFYSNYSSCITYITDNTSKMYSDITSNIDFTSPAIDNLHMMNMFPHLLKDKVADIMSLYSDRKLYSDNLVKTMKRNLEKFVRTNKVNNINFSRVPKFNTSASLEYIVTSVDEIVDVDVINEVNKLYTISGYIGSTLNYYR